MYKAQGTRLKAQEQGTRYKVQEQGTRLKGQEWSWVFLLPVPCAFIYCSVI
jgi:uncharacterized protein YmfQ (DUF2313 family)